MAPSSSPVNGVAAPVATVNCHLWQPCNMKRGHCFAIFEDTPAAIAERGVKVVPETNELMTGSYAMVDPLGRFYDDVRGMRAYSDPILKVGAEKALSQVSVSPERFAERGGDYE